MKRLVAVVAVLLMAGTAGATLIYDGGSEALPNIVNTAQDAGAGAFRVGENSDGYLEVDVGGSITNIGWTSFGRNGWKSWVWVNGGSIGTVASKSPDFYFYGQGAGSALKVTSGAVYVGGSSGIVNVRFGINNGTIAMELSGTGLFRSDSDTALGYSSAGTACNATINQSGGTFQTIGGANAYMGYAWTPGAGTQVWNVSGGTVSLGNDLRVATVDDGGTAGGMATFHVDGSAASISLGGRLRTSTNATLKFTLDSGGVSAINQTIPGDWAALKGKIDMALGAGASPAPLSFFDLVVSSGGGTFSLASLSLSPEDVGTWALDNTVAGKLRAQYLVPEPATMGLLGLGLVGLVLRRKK